MSYNAVNTQTVARQFRARVKRRPISIHIPKHISFRDQTPEADRKRYDLHVAMMRMNPRGWRTVGKKGGDNRLAALARRGYKLADPVPDQSDIMRLLSETWNKIKGAFTHE